LVNAVLVRGLPFESPERIIALGATDARSRQLGISRLDLHDWQSAKRKLLWTRPFSTRR
jgi:hypothetical protein